MVHYFMYVSMYVRVCVCVRVYVCWCARVYAVVVCVEISSRRSAVDKVLNDYKAQVPRTDNAESRLGLCTRSILHSNLARHVQTQSPMVQRSYTTCNPEGTAWRSRILWIPRSVCSHYLSPAPWRTLSHTHPQGPSMQAEK